MRKLWSWLSIILLILFATHCTQQKVSEKEADIALYSDKGTDWDLMKRAALWCMKNESQ